MTVPSVYKPEDYKAKLEQVGGATGEHSAHITRTLCLRPASTAFETVRLGVCVHIQVTVNFDNFASEALPAMKGADSVFCCLGTTRKVIMRLVCTHDP